LIFIVSVRRLASYMTTSPLRFTWNLYWFSSDS
jgi:hypothetical protein